MRPARLWPCARQTLAPKGLTAHNGTDLVAVDVEIANLDLARHLGDAVINAAVHPKGQAIALCIHIGHNPRQIAGLISGHMQDRAKDFALKVVDPTGQ